MAKQIEDKKRSFEQSEQFIHVSPGALSNSFKSKTDFLSYFGQMLQVSSILSSILNLRLNSVLCSTCKLDHQGVDPNDLEWWQEAGALEASEVGGGGKLP